MGPRFLRFAAVVGTSTLAMFGWAPERGYARQPVAVRIPLEPLDYQELPEQVRNSGASVMTLHYVDGQHLLLTFHRRRLMPRIVGDPPTDVDRNIDALLLELPTGRVVARTNWRVHDAGAYLWPLGGGRFLLRQRDLLSVVAPMAGGGSAETAFALQPLIASARPIGTVLVSPVADLLTVETMDHSPYGEKERSPSPGTRAYAAAAAAATAGDEAAENPTPVQVDFFRLRAGTGRAELQLVKAGTFGARALLLLPVDGDGYLASLDQGRAHWAFDFHRHDGRVEELSPFDSTCRPMPFLVSRSEFIAFGCRGGKDRREIGGFNLRGEEMWEQTFQESFIHPTLAFAPAAGRFALGRLITSLPPDDNQSSDDTPTAEDVTVYQTETGRQLLHLSVTPVMRAPQNFDLSPDGGSLAVINGGAIEIYPLPPMSGKEREAVHLAETLVPQGAEQAIRLTALTSHPAAEGAARGPGAARTANAGASAADQGAADQGTADQGPAKAGAAAAAGKEPRAAVVAARSGEAADAAAESSAGAAAESSAGAAAGGPTAGSGQGSSGAAAPKRQERVVELGDAPVDGTEHRKAPTLYQPGEKPGADGEASR